MSNINQKQVFIGPSQMQRMVGKKGSLFCWLGLDFSAAGAPTYHLDLQNQQANNFFDFCQTIFIDNSLGGDTVKVSIPGSRQMIIAKAGTQGYYNVICPNPIVMDISSNGGALATIILINTAIPGAVWSTN
jgi:hypothetical protein